MSDRVVLYIDRSSSRCGACGKSCLPSEEAHSTPCGYDQHEGCGARYTHLSSNCFGGGIEEAAQHMRPDLPWVTFWEATATP